MLVFSVALLAVSVGASAADCEYSAPRNAKLDAAGLNLLSVELGSNNLVIQGQPGLKKVVVHGTACVSNKDWLQDVKVETSRHGSTARVIADNGHHNINFSLFGSSYAYLKLDVRVPETLAVKLMAGSGESKASHLAALDTTLGSGDLEVHHIAGKFSLSVGSGEAKAHDVGSLDLSAVGSGDASVGGVHGNARIGSVGSGSLHLRHVKGDVSMGPVASGDAKVVDVGGGFTADSVGSGDLEILGVTGNVSVGSIASGDVETRHTGGNVHVTSLGSGDLDVGGVGGNLRVDEVGSGDVIHHGVVGLIHVPHGNDH